MSTETIVATLYVKRGVSEKGTRCYAASVQRNGIPVAIPSAVGSSHAVAIKRALESLGLSGEVRPAVTLPDDNGTKYHVWAIVPDSPSDASPRQKSPGEVVNTRCPGSDVPNNS